MVRDLLDFVKIENYMRVVFQLVMIMWKIRSKKSVYAKRKSDVIERNGSIKNDYKKKVQLLTIKQQ